MGPDETPSPGVTVMDVPDPYVAVTAAARLMAAGIPCVVRPSAIGRTVEVIAGRAAEARAALRSF